MFRPTCFSARWICWNLLLGGLIASVPPVSSFGQQTQFVEEFVLAADREAILQTLVPGTEDYYYYHALHYQLSEQFEKVATVLKPWIEKHGTTARVNEIRHRQELLLYSQNPRETLAYLIRELNLHFNHQRQISPAEQNLPSGLDPALIDPQRLLTAALSEHANTEGLETRGLEWLASRLDQLNRNQRRHLLARLQYPDFPKLMEFLLDDFAQPDRPGFGAYPIHFNLTLAQMDELSRQVPALRSEAAFVGAYCRKLQPNDDVNPALDREAYQEYLERLLAYVDTLDPAFNSLKASVRFHQLLADRQNGRYDRDRFLAYLKLPRQIHYINPKQLERVVSGTHYVDLQADFSGATRLRPVADEQPLVLDFLQQFLREDADPQVFSPYFEADFLRKQFATAKILAGLGDINKWTAILSPEEYQAVLDRTEIEFAPHNPLRFKSADPVSLQLRIKNVKNLLVKIYEVNTENFYRQNGREIGTDINLDGLVPNWQRKFDYDSAPALQVTRDFEFPELDHAGVFVVDFIGNGKSSRALIRKGDLSYLSRITPQGHEFTLLDETGTIQKTADLWLSGRRFAADAEGLIRVPFSTQPGNQTLILRQGNFSVLDTFAHAAESYELLAGIFVDRESLLKLRPAQVVVRPALRVAGSPIPIGKSLQKVRLQITTVNQDGNPAVKIFENLELNERNELVCEFQSPPRLASVQIQLTAEIRNHSLNQTQSLSVEQSLVLNQIDRSDEIADVHLIQSAGRFLLETRGLTGELLRKQPVGIVLKHTQFSRQIPVTLQSNDQGQIDLGELPGIEWLKATTLGGSERAWAIDRVDRQSQANSIHSLTGQRVTVVAPPEVQRPEDVALFELRAGQVVADRQAQIEQVGELLQIEPLDRGDYWLVFKPTGTQISIRVTQGDVVGGVFRGPSRKLEFRQLAPLHLASAQVDEQQLTLELGAAGPHTRVHVLASRFSPRWNAGAALGAVRDIEPAVYLEGVKRNAYLAGRAIGDEYQYILNRQTAPKFPGNMLERPSLLLNPWSLGPTDNREQALADGGEFGNVADMTPPAAMRPDESGAGTAGTADFSNLDFLDQNTVVLANLRPDEQGQLQIPREKLNGKQHLVVVITDLFQTVQRTLTLPAETARIRDLRLATGLDPQAHLSLQKVTETLAGGSKFAVADILTARVNAYDDLGDVFRLLTALTPDTRLQEFQFLTGWNQLDLDTKRSLYSKYACHELNFFIYRKDPEFFQAAIQPLLQNKFQKTFVDRWLIGEPLERYLDSWQFAQLNVFEKILLAQRLETQRVDILRHLTEMYQLQPPDRAELDRLFDTAIVSNLQSEELGNYLKEAEKLLGGDLGKKLPELSANMAPPGSAADPMAAREESLSKGEERKSAGRSLSRRGQGGGGFGGGGRDMPMADSLDRVAGEPKADADAASEKNQYQLQAGMDDKSSSDYRFKQELDRQFQNNFLHLGEDAESNGQNRFYQRIRPTEEWVESNYYRLRPEESTRDRVPINGFWLDVANAQPGQPFLSQQFPQASRNLSEALLALAWIDLPAKAQEHQIEFAERSMNWTLGGAAILFHQQIRPAIFDRRNTTILVSENFFQKNDRYRYENNLQYDKFITEKFSTQTLYGGQVVITNPTSTPQVVQLLIQIPQGAVAASGSQETRTINLQLPAFHSQSFDYSFYFPTAGQFEHFPAHVADGQRVLATAENLTFQVVAEPVRIDSASWEFVSQNGTPDEVVEFLGRENLLRLDLGKIAFRMNDPQYFERVTSLLRERHAYHHDLWSYALKHDNRPAIREYLSHAEGWLSQCGRFLESPLVHIDPLARGWYEQREFWPLVNIRAHQVGKRREILNSRIFSQYHDLLTILSYRPKLGSEDQLALTYYLLLQDRVGEALERFASVRPDELASRLQYDYCAAYLKMIEQQPEAALEIAHRYQSYPVEHWQKRFAAVIDQVAEIRGARAQIADPENSAQVQTQAAEDAESFQFEVTAGSISLDYLNLEQVTVNIYEMDAELLFSRSPFETNQQGGFSMIRPNASLVIELDRQQKQTQIELPAEFRTKNVLVEIAAKEQTKSQAVYANDLNVQFLEAFGQVKVAAKSSGELLPKTYVKVYAQRADGTVLFLKDGYTDLRGKFDYVTQSNISLNGIQQLAVLVLNPDHGTIIRTVGLPKE